MVSRPRVDGPAGMLTGDCDVDLMATDGIGQVVGKAPPGSAGQGVCTSEADQEVP